MSTSRTIDALRSRVSDVEADRGALSEDASRLHQRVADLTDVIRQADATLERSHAWLEHNTAREQRAAAMAERSEVNAQLQSIHARDNAIIIDLANLQHALARAEYEARGIPELKKDAQGIAAHLRATDAGLAALEAERHTLEARQAAAEKACETVNAADEELCNAREALERQQGDAFIAGGEADLSPCIARLAKADKRLATTTSNASAAKVALPRIAERLEAIQNEQAELERQRQKQVAAYWENRQRQAEIGYKKLVADLMSTVQTIVALDKLTGSRLGDYLLNGIRHGGLHMPVNGVGTEPLNTAQWFGNGLVPDVSRVLTKLNEELEMALANREKATM